MYNDVIYNTVPDYTPPGTTVPTPIPYAQGVHINSESTDNTSGESPLIRRYCSTTRSTRRLMPYRPWHRSPT